MNILCLLVSRKGDLEALDEGNFTPILTAAACKNHDSLNIMVKKGGNSLKSTLFQAAKEPSKSNIQALEVMLMSCMLIFFPALLSSASILF